MIPLGLWHCFGHREPAVDLETVRAMLDASGTELLPVNTNRGLRIGHGDVTWDSFRDEADERGLTPCLNINLQTTAMGAYWQAVEAGENSGIPLLKFEVLTEDLMDSNDRQCLVAIPNLIASGFQVMPLLKRGWAAEQAAEIGVPLIRIMGSPIGSGKGILDPDNVRRAVATGVPVILDGGIASVEHAQEALDLGCAGFLVNSCLFTPGSLDPAQRLGFYRDVFAKVAA